MDATVKATLMAEAKFFRAFNYFYLVKIFGPIPLNQTPYISASQDMQLSRSTVADVYALIEADLKTAVDVLPAKSFASNNHRITKYAAAMLLTSVYMQEGKYSDAATCAKIVVGSGVHVNRIRAIHKCVARKWLISSEKFIRTKINVCMYKLLFSSL